MALRKSTSLTYTRTCLQLSRLLDAILYSFPFSPRRDTMLAWYMKSSCVCVSVTFEDGTYRRCLTVLLQKLWATGCSGGATILKVGCTICERSERNIFLTPHYFVYLGGTGNRRLQFSLLQFMASISPHSISLAGRKPAESWLKAG